MDATSGTRSSGGSGRGGSVPTRTISNLVGALAIAAFAGLPGGFAAGALAQETPTIARSITVIGYGLATGPAERATIQFVATQEEFGPPRAPDPDATPGAEEREAIAPMVDGLIAAGVAEEEIEIVVSSTLGGYSGPGGPGIARVDVALEDPTAERIDELIDAAIVGAAEENLVVNPIGVGYGVEDCEPLEREAREAALADARTRAGIQAELMGVELGEPVAARDVPVAPASALSAYYGPYAPTQTDCAPPTPTVPTGAPISVPPFDPTTGAQVQSYVQVEITFEITGASDS